MPYVFTGIRAVDEAVAGFVPGSLVVVCADDPETRGELVLHLAAGAAREGAGVVYAAARGGSSQAADLVPLLPDAPTRSRVHAVGALAQPAAELGARLVSMAQQDGRIRVAVVEDLDAFAGRRAHRLVHMKHAARRGGLVVFAGAAGPRGRKRRPMLGDFAPSDGPADALLHLARDERAADHLHVSKHRHGADGLAVPMAWPAWR